MRSSFLFCVTLLLAQMSFADEDSVIASGTGVVPVQPDVAIVNLTVVSRGKSSQEAQKLNAQTKATLTNEVVKTLGMKESDLKTTGYSFGQEWDYENNKRKYRGYLLRHSLAVEVKDLKRLGKVVDVLGASGVQELSDIGFSSSKQEALELEALDAAVKNARTKAEVMAKAAGRQIGHVKSIVPTGTPMGPVHLAAKAAAFDASTQINTSDLKVTANVTVEFGLK